MEHQDIRLYCVHLNQCDPKKCTATKLKRLGCLEIRKTVNRCPQNAIILDPFSDIVLNSNDSENIRRYGLIVIDCSWERTDTIFKTKFRNGRKLPKLLAANSVNYGRWNRLSSVEALAAALMITGFMEKAKEILSKFSWGEEFIRINNFEKESE